MNYYNEYDKFAAQWLRELIKDGLIKDGFVDERPIQEVKPEDLNGYDQCHFFAGIGGWPLALEMAGLRDEKNIWTGSPPCQSFSNAGKRTGKDDERHLWPTFYHLIAQCSPGAVFGEQVDSAIRYGWSDDLQADFEREGYTFGFHVLPACSVGAPHRRYRIFFGATLGNAEHLHGGRALSRGCAERSASAQEERATQGDRLKNSSEANSPLANTTGKQNHEKQQRPEEAKRKGCSNESSGCDLANKRFFNLQKLVYCRDGKYRPIPTEPALFPLAHGLPNRVGTLRGAGNAIVPQVAALFIETFLEEV